MVARMVTVAFEGVEARRVDVEVQMTGGNVYFAVVGLGDKAVAESRERVRSAFASLGLALPGGLLPPVQFGLSPFLGRGDAFERAAEALREVLHRQRPAAPAVTHPAQALLLSLANTLLLERDQLEARIADQSVPLVLTPLRRRKGERDHVPLMTANDRG